MNFFDGNILMDKTRDIGICRCMDLVQTHKCSLLIMGLPFGSTDSADSL